MFVRSSYQTVHVLILVFLTASFFGGVTLSARAQDFSPSAPLISSPEYANEEQWYRTIGGSFRWQIPSDVTAVAVGMATSTEYEPTFVYEPAISRYTPTPAELTPGVQYVSVQYRNADGWGDVGYRKLKLDQTPPSGLYIDIVPHTDDQTATIIFGATDELSGIAGYALYVNGTGPIFLSPEAAGAGYEVAQYEPGMYEVYIVAYDRAGNFISNRFPVFVVTEKEHPKELWFGLYTSRELMAVLLLSITILSLWYAVYTRQYYRRKERRIRDEMFEIQDQMGKIFTALRDEIHDQIQTIRNRSRLTKGEQSVVENLDKALQVSETLVEKEVKDVKKMLK